jgi:Signal peptide binding domain
MIPGLPQDLLQGSDEEGAVRLKRMIYITDSMSSTELDSDGSLFMEFAKDGKPVGLTWRVSRVARGSGTTVKEVEELLCQYRMMANMAKQAGGKNGWLQAMQKMQSAGVGRGRGAGGMPTPAQIQAMQVCGLTVCGPSSPKRCYYFFLEFATARYASTDATPNEEWRWHPRNDENFDAKSRRGPDGYGGDATHDGPDGWPGWSGRSGWGNAQYGRHVQVDGDGQRRTIGEELGVRCSGH